MTGGERLVHFSAQVVTEVHNQHPAPGHMKPRGFWVSVEGNGDGWSDWCRNEEFELERLAYVHEVTLTQDANILRIDNGERLDAFDDQWHIQPDWSDPIQRKYHRRIDSKIDWQAVARRWQGIIISPYLWSHRLDGPFWYYGWDCASGCIWDVEAIECISLPPSVVAS